MAKKTDPQRVAELLLEDLREAMATFDILAISTDEDGHGAAIKAKQSIAHNACISAGPGPTGTTNHRKGG